VNAHRALDLTAIAVALAGVVADATMNGGEGVVLNEKLPGASVVTFYNFREPTLDVLASRTGCIAGRKKVQIDGPSDSDRPCRSISREVGRQR